MTGIILSVVIGCLAGFCAGKLMKGGGFGFLMNLLLGQDVISLSCIVMNFMIWGTCTRQLLPTIGLLENGSGLMSRRRMPDISTMFSSKEIQPTMAESL